MTAREGGDAADMIRVLVGYEYRIERPHLKAGPLQPLAELAQIETVVDQDSARVRSVPHLDQQAVAAAARAETADAQHGPPFSVAGL